MEMHSANPPNTMQTVQQEEQQMSAEGREEEEHQNQIRHTRQQRWKQSYGTQLFFSLQRD